VDLDEILYGVRDIKDDADHFKMADVYISDAVQI
jgi:hypothetical protein